MTETIPICLGYVSLVSKSGVIRNKFPLLKSTLTFGRSLTSDCRIMLTTCSKEHATIFVDQSTTPYTALLKVHSSNGLVFNGNDFSKGSDIPLNSGDEFVITDRIFRWEEAPIENIVNVDSTPASSRKSIRYSLIALANVSTPTRSNTVPNFDGFASPSPFGVQIESSVPPVEPLGFEGGIEENGDLITWDEVDEEIVEEVEEIEEVEVEEVEEEVELEVESVTPAVGASPIRRVLDFMLGATPALADRARSIRPPTSVRRTTSFTPITKSKTTRRTSLRMTIAPQSRTIDWSKELELQKAAKALALASASPLPNLIAPVSLPSTPSPINSLSTPTKFTNSTPSLIASDHSQTSRRISTLLLTPRSDSGNAIDVYESDEDAEGISDNSSSDGEEEDEFAQIIARSSNEVSDNKEEGEEVPLHIAVSEKLRILETETEEEEDVEEDEDKEEEVEEESTFATALITALPDSPYGSPTATPQAPRLPRHTPSRRHSLREKVLIRSAIRTTITPPPQSPTEELDLNLQVDEKSINQGEGELGEEAQAEELVAIIVRAQDIPLPESPAVVLSSPRRTPASAHRDSIEIFRSRSGPKQLFVNSGTIVVATPEIPAQDVEMLSADSSEEFVEAADLPASPSPAERAPVVPVAREMFTPRTDQQIRAAAIPLPVTPIHEDEPEEEEDGEDTDSFNPLLTPVKLVQQPPASPMDHRDAFFSEMTSPVTQHRVMATPRSVLRVGPSTGGRRKSIRGFLSFTAPPPSTRRKVVFNEQVYIQEIVDIRDQSLHWNPKIDKVPVSPRSVPLPVSPAPSEMGTPRTSTRPTTPTSTARRAQRVPTDAPPSIVRRAISEAQELASPSALLSPRRVPIKSPAPAANLESTPRNLTSPIKSTPSLSASVQKAQRVAISTPTFRKASSSTTTSITSLLESTIPQVNSPATASRAPSKSALWAQVAEVQKRATQQRLSGSTRTPTGTSAASVFKPKSTLKSALKATSILSGRKIPLKPTFDSTSTSTSTSTTTPIQFVQHRLAATPNLIGFRKMFGPSSTPSISATPNLAGMRSLFNVAITQATPGMEGLREMMKTPVAATPGSRMLMSEGHNPDGSPTPMVRETVEALEAVSVVVEKLEVVEEAEVAPVVLAEKPEIVEEEIIVEEAQIIVAPIEEVISAPEAIDEILVEEEEVVVAQEEEVMIPEVEIAQPLAVEEVEQIQVEQEVEPQVESELEVESLVEVETPIVIDEAIEVPVIEEEEVISTPAMEEVSPIVIEEVVTEEIVTVVEELAVEEVIPVVEIASAVMEEEADEEEEVIIAAPTRRGRPTAAKAAIKKAPTVKKTRATKSVEVEVVENEDTEELEVITLPTRAKPATKSKAKAVTEVGEVVIEVAPVVAAKGRGRAKKVVEVEVLEIVEEVAKVERVTATKGRRAATKAAVVPVVEILAEVELPVVEKKKPAPRGRAKPAPKETLLIHEDSPEEAIEHQPKSVVVAVKSTRGKKAVVNENVGVAVTTEKTKTKKATTISKVVEDVVVVAPTRALRTRRALA